MTEILCTKILRIKPEQTDIPLPKYATDGSAGMDICAAVEQDIELQPGRMGTKRRFGREAVLPLSTVLEFLTRPELLIPIIAAR
jgi:dUTPase